MRLCPLTSAQTTTSLFLIAHQSADVLSAQTNTFLPLSCAMAPTYSESASAGPSSPNFQLIFNNALKAYEKRTKNDLLAHPLAAQLQACQSPTSILAILQQQVQEFNRSRSSDERLTKWLDPTVNVLYAFSATLGEGVGLVCINASTHLI